MTSFSPHVLADSSNPLLTDCIWAIGRLNIKNTSELVRCHLEHPDTSVRDAAVLALLRLGDVNVVRYCLEALKSEQWPIPFLSLCAYRAIAGTPLGMAQNGPLDPSLCIALGLLGGRSSVPVLLDALTTEESASSAAIALQAITGAELYEKVFVPEEIDEDTLFEWELEKLKAGEVLVRPDGQPYGENVVRLSQDRWAWNEWWNAHQNKFEPDTRYRYGKPYSPSQLLSCLTWERGPHLLRRYAYEELVIRYGLNLPFDVDMPVTWQMQMLEAIAEWVDKNETRFQPGRWYFKGLALA